MNPAVLILHFKDSLHTLPCLDSLTKVKTGFSVYILSIQSTNSKVLMSHALQPIVLDTQHNKGFAWANNQLIRRAAKDGCDTFILLNNDTTADPDFLTPLLNQLSKPRVGLVCPKIYFSPGNEFHKSGYAKSELGKVIWYAGGVIDWANVNASHWGVDEVDHGQFDQSVETDFATGCCLGITQKTIDKIGYLNEKYFLYFEDADWSQMAKQAGLKIIFEPQSVIYHKNAGSTNGSGSKLQGQYHSSSRLRFGLKYAPLRTKLHLLKNQILNS